jgi:cytochrome c biogenesis protein CcdA/thiol-disulfide isomerase/thioredoxin
MALLLGFAFLAGVVTILSPCILPILPIILTSTIGGKESSKSRPLGVVAGFVLSFTFFTLFLSTIVRVSGISADFLRGLSIVIVASFGVSLLNPRLQALLERLFSKLVGFIPQGQNRSGFGGGMLLGFSLGLLWTPCVGPILASVISLAITGIVTLDTFFITLAYSLGTAIPMFLIMFGGQNALKKVPWLLANTGRIQKAFGVIMILTAIGIFFNIDRKFQTYFLTAFPQYGVGLTKFEDNEVVKKQLQNVNQKPVNQTKIGKPTFDMTLPKGSVAPELIPGGVWFNSKPLRLSDLRGKVVLVDFWTYTCINCQRTFPYLRQWHEKYKDKGLVIIGVHSPEFEFEKSESNLAKAIKDFDLRYPIVQDNNFDTWRAYNNRYWPAKYFIDKDGYIRYTHFGEGAYDESEKVIQELLKETGSTNLPPIGNLAYQTYAKTPEIYLGNARFSGKYVTFEGDWEVGQEYRNPQKGAKLLLTFEAKEVFLVMRAKENPARVKVYLDDKMQYPGVDVVDGVVTVDSDRLYKLISLPAPGRHLLRLEFLDNNVEVFAFTFG